MDSTGIKARKTSLVARANHLSAGPLQDSVTEPKERDPMSEGRNPQKRRRERVETTFMSKNLLPRDRELLLLKGLPPTLLC